MTTNNLKHQRFVVVEKCLIKHFMKVRCFYFHNSPTFRKAEVCQRHSFLYAMKKPPVFRWLFAI